MVGDVGLQQQRCSYKMRDLRLLQNEPNFAGYY